MEREEGGGVEIRVSQFERILGGRKGCRLEKKGRAARKTSFFIEGGGLGGEEGLRRGG